MNTDIEDGRDVADLLSRAAHSKAVTGPDPDSILRLAKRRQHLVRTAAAGGVAIGVVAAVGGLAVLQGVGHSSAGKDIAPAVQSDAKTPTKGDPCTALTTMPPDNVADAEEAWKECKSRGTSPVPDDDNSRKLTEALRGAKATYIPAGMEASPPEGMIDKPFAFRQSEVKPPHYTDFTAIGNADGIGMLRVDVAKENGPVSCADPATFEPYYDQVQASCGDQTLGDGTQVSIARYTAPKDAKFFQVMLHAVKPDGTHIRLMTNNTKYYSFIFTPPEGSPNKLVTIAQPPLDDAALLKIVQIPGLKL